MQSLEEFTTKSSIWDMNLPRKFLEQFIEDLNNKIKLGNGIQGIPSDIENNDWKFLYFFWKLFNDRRFMIDNGNEENVDNHHHFQILLHLDDR